MGVAHGGILNHAGGICQIQDRCLRGNLVQHIISTFQTRSQIRGRFDVDWWMSILYHLLTYCTHALQFMLGASQQYYAQLWPRLYLTRPVQQGVEEFRSGNAAST